MGRRYRPNVLRNPMHSADTSVPAMSTSSGVRQEALLIKLHRGRGRRRPGRPARAFTAPNPDAPWELEHGYIAADGLAWREEFDPADRAVLDELVLNNAMRGKW